MNTELVKQETPQVGSVERSRDGITFSPRVDIWETDEKLVLYADMPGVQADDLDIQYENRELRIHGRVQPRHDGLNFMYGEYGIGDFYRTFSLGEVIDAEKISAELNHGVLTLHLPKAEAARPRRIEVKHG